MKLSELIAQAHRLLAERGDLDVYADGCDCGGEAGRLILDPEAEGQALLQRYANVSAKCPKCGAAALWNGGGDEFFCLDCDKHDLTLAELRS